MGQTSRRRAATLSWITAVLALLGLASVLVGMPGMHIVPSHTAYGSAIAYPAASQKSFRTESVATPYLTPEGTDTHGTETAPCAQCHCDSCTVSDCQMAIDTSRITTVPTAAAGTGAAVSVIQARSLACPVPAAVPVTVSFIQLSVRRI